MELQHIGKICSIRECKQKDFLPYKCTCCENTYCQEHFRQESHDCKQANRFAKKAIECPFCLKTIKYTGTHTEVEALDIHQATECDQKNREKVLQEQIKIVCESGKKCKQFLTDINTYVCKQCDRQLCLKHRIPEEHICQRIKRDPQSKKIIQVEDRLQQIRLNEQQQNNPNILGGNIDHKREYVPNQYQAQTNRSYQQQIAQSQQQQQEQLNERRQLMLQRQSQQTQPQQQQQPQQQIQQQQIPQQQQISQQQLAQQQQWSQYYQNINSQQQPQQQIQQQAQQQIFQQQQQPLQQYPQQQQLTQQQLQQQNQWTQYYQASQNQQPVQQQQQQNQVRIEPGQQQNINQRNQPANYREPSREICNVCGRSFETIMELLSHAESTHQNNSSNNFNQPQSSDQSSNNQQNRQQIQQQQQQPKEICDVCGKSFNGFDELISHAEKVHFVQSN